jgi:formylglycine-generating enzyme required for sulfatase activity
MAGNASEWVADGFSYYDGACLRNPFTPPTEDTGINRGGSRVEAAGFPPLSADQLDEGHIIRSAHRAGGDSPFSSDDHLGFRVVVDYLERP